jgi:DNA-binding GntR family transcriptional regulator
MLESSSGIVRPMSKLSENLRESIEEDITTGKLAPGTRLEEMQLAAQYGVSRTPVREALVLLTAEGLVEPRTGRGTVVKEVPFERVVEMFEVMGELEAFCARHAARRMTDAGRAALIAVHKACEEAYEIGNSDAYFYANEKFHEFIYVASQNQFLYEQATALHRRLRPYRRLQLRVRDRMSKSLQEHAEIVQAIIRNDAEGVVSLMRNHILVQGERFGDLLASVRIIATAATQSAIMDVKGT